jgi:hypothetical protein
VHGGDPRQWCMAWSREHGVSSKDRTWHEMTLLCQVLVLATTYDALNVGGLASLEAIARRVAAITEALRGGPGAAPRWEASRFIMGSVDPYDMVSSELRSHVARVTKEETERDSLQARAGRAAAAPGAEDAARWGGLPRVPDKEWTRPPGKGREKGKGKEHVCRGPFRAVPYNAS